MNDDRHPGGRSRRAEAGAGRRRGPQPTTSGIMPAMRVFALTLLLVAILGGCAAERTIYRDSDGRIQEQWKCPYAACLGMGQRPIYDGKR